jgi:ABC-2 type transport system ATP-binding protein
MSTPDLSAEDCVIQLKDISKSYAGLSVLRQLTLEVKRGEIYGFLGPNGSGKTTTIMILLGIEKPSSGSYSILGQFGRLSASQLWRKVGFVPEQQHLYENNTAWEYLSFFAKLYQVSHPQRIISQWLDRMGLAEKRNTELAHLSNGQRQKLSIARALLHDPELLILDEPVQGLDPMGVRDLRMLIKELNQQGRTVFLSSHVLSEVEKTADRVGILYQGVLLAEDSMASIRTRLEQGTVYQIEVLQLNEQILAALENADFVSTLHCEGTTITLKVTGEKDYRDAISKCIVQHGGSIIGWTRKEISLEEAFMTITDQQVAQWVDR